MNEPESSNVTELLRRWSNGSEDALEELTPIVHAELYRLAKGYMARERAGHTLQPTALVNEAFVRLIDWENTRWENRAHFYGVAARMMRRILVDFARKRPKGDGAELLKVSLDKADEPAKKADPDILALDEALSTLAELDERKARIVELKFFGGLKTNEIAEILGVAEITILREWKKAKAWLHLELSR
ncbi:MAG: sigma-70 family RNA polymerase sigma factor [Acidobacteria bacterium]|nr:sigma-70 family RNA polymerase sigma factor [Acidobacteriota bacterium]